MLTENMKGTVNLILRVLIGGVLFYAGLSKALDSGMAFARAIESIHLVPHACIMLVAFFLPWAEMIVGIYLISGFWTRAFARVAGVMFILYLGAILSTVLRHLSMGSCVCFGPELMISPEWMIFFDVVLFGACVTLFRVSTAQRFALDSWIDR